MGKLVSITIFSSLYVVRGINAIGWRIISGYHSNLSKYFEILVNIFEEAGINI